MNNLKENNINKSIYQKLSNKDEYETNMHKIYNLIVGQNNEQFQDKAESDTTFWSVKKDQDPIG